MLRITYTGTAEEQRWDLFGQSAGPWVAELRSAWEQERTATGERRVIVDLSDVTFIDENGETLLRDLQVEGAEFIAGCGVETRDLIEDLRIDGTRPVRRYLARRDACT